MQRFFSLPYSGTASNSSYLFSVTNSGTGGAIFGQVSSGTTPGVYGFYAGSGAGYGVYGGGGGSSSYGVYGTSGYVGVYGTGNAYGVQGSGAVTGVYGTGTDTGASGVSGTAGSGSAASGVYGTSAGAGAGISGSSSTGYGGYFLSSSGTSLYAGGGSGYAAEFNGTVKFDGSLTGTHAQNFGTGDAVTVQNLTSTGNVSASQFVYGSYGSFSANSIIPIMQLTQSGSGVAFQGNSVNGTAVYGAASGTGYGGNFTSSGGVGIVVSGGGQGASIVGVSNGMSVQANTSGGTAAIVTNLGTGYGLRVYSAGATSAYFSDSSGGSCTIANPSGLTCTSDLSLKTAVRALAPDDVLRVLGLRPVTFRWKQSGVESSGLIAQEVRKVLPQVVHAGEDGKLMISYQELIPYLVKAVQVQAAELDKLKKEKRNVSGRR